MAPAESWEKTLGQLEVLLEADDFENALAVAHSLLEAREDAAVRDIEERCRRRLSQKFRARIGSLSAVPVLKVAPKDLMALDLDHREGFILSHVDGVSSFEMILDLSTMPRLEVLRLLAKLIDDGVIGV